MPGGIIVGIELDAKGTKMSAGCNKGFVTGMFLQLKKDGRRSSTEPDRSLRFTLNLVSPDSLPCAVNNPPKIS